MRAGLLFGLIVVAAAAGFAPVPVARKRLSADDVKNVQGLWRVVRYDRGGRPVNPPGRVLRVRVEQNRWIFLASQNGMPERRTTTYELVIDQKLSPKGFGWKNQNAAALTWVGSYLIERDQIQMVFKSGTSLRARSTSLASPTPADYVMVLRREGK